jgi:O-antigen ligase
VAIYSTRLSAFRLPEHFGLVLTIILISLFTGLLAAVLPWWIVIALFLLPIAGITTLVVPEIGIVILLLALSGVIPPSLLPEIPVGPGKLLTSDLLIMLLTLIAFFRVKGKVLTESLSWTKPVLLLMCLTVVGIVVGKFFFGSAVKDVLQEARIQINWMIVFLILFFVDNEKRLGRFMTGVLFVALVIAAAVIFQFATGKQIIANARVEDLLTLTTSYSDVTRSTAGGAIYFVAFGFFFVLARLFTRQMSIFFVFPMALILAAGILVSFGRGIWFTTALAALFMAYLLRGPRGVAQILVALSIAVMAALTMLAMFKPATIEAAYDRVISTGKEGDRNSSLGWRIEEAEFAFKKIIQSPLVGIGYGTPYKPLIRLSGKEDDIALMRYIHNAYIGLWLKLGLGGLVAVVWLSWGTLKRGIRESRHLANEKLRSLAAALTAGFLVPLMTSMTQPEWIAPLGIAYFALVIGLFAVVNRLKQAE